MAAHSGGRLQKLSFDNLFFRMNESLLLQSHTNGIFFFKKMKKKYKTFGLGTLRDVQFKVSKLLGPLTLIHLTRKFGCVQPSARGPE